MHTTPFNAETAYVIATISLFSTGHWIGGSLCLILGLYTSSNDKKTAEQANFPSDEIGSVSTLPPIEPKPDAASTEKPDAFTGHEG